MLITAIDKNGNRIQFESQLNHGRETRFQKIGEVYFEQSIEPPVKETKKPAKTEKKVEEMVEEEVMEEGSSATEQAMKEFLKMKKVRGWGLLKGEGLEKRAMAEGFILNQ